MNPKTNYLSFIFDRKTVFHELKAQCYLKSLVLRTACWQSLGCACLLKAVFLMLWVTHACMIIGKSFAASISKNQNQIKTVQNGKMLY